MSYLSTTETIDTIETTETVDTIETTETIESIDFTVDEVAEISEETNNIDVIPENGEQIVDVNVDSSSEIETTESTDFTVDEVAEITGETNDTNVVPEGGQVINVDADFGGDIANAIAAATDGDVIKLGPGVYYTFGITIDKDITIDGESGSKIDGGGTDGSIISLTPNASGATIQDVEISNGNNGIFSDNVNNLTLQNLKVSNIGINQVNRSGQNNTAINLNKADGLQIFDTTIENVGRKGIGIGDTDGAIVSGVTVEGVNLDAQHSQSHDAAGIKLFNTNNVQISNSYLANINANHIWNDTSSNTSIEGNIITGVGNDFIKPSFDSNIDISGIYNEKSPYSSVNGNNIDALEEFAAFNATEFSSESMYLEGNNFSSTEIGTTDYWANEQAERLIALTEDPSQADFSLFQSDYYGRANIG